MQTDTKNLGCVYAVFNKRSESVYVGKTKFTVDIRRKQHELEAKRIAKSPFHKALVSYGADAFEWHEIYPLNEADPATLNELEKFYIKEFREDGYKLYNLTDGGDGGDTGVYNIKKWKQTMKSWNPSKKKAYREKMKRIALDNGYGKWMLGKKLSTKTKRKISEALKNRLVLNCAYCGVQIEKQPCLVNRCKRNFCSKSCMGKFYSRK
ncbi:MAG: GIY-YIG nuclease family protein [Candidatus Micrarchaeota archaeon]